MDSRDDKSLSYAYTSNNGGGGDFHSNNAVERPPYNKKINSYKRHSTSPTASSNSYGDLPTSFQSSRNRHSYSSESTIDYEDLDAEVLKYFDKRFYFAAPICDWQLPRPNDLFVQPKWQIPDLQRMKEQLNHVKNKLNDYNLDDWHKHTRSMNKAGEIHWRLRKEYEPEFLTQAWCKLYENLVTFLMVPSVTVTEANCFNSVHLCEAPGAFITALNHYLKLNHPGISWRWMATTLNPYYEGNPLSCMINDDRFILQTLPHWNFGVDFTGNLMDLDNMHHFVSEANTMGDVLLVTADGSIDCQEDPGEQETVVASLHYCEAITALHLLAEGGNFLLKMFTLYECDTVCLLYLLCCSFKKVVVNKPATSKEGNSEVYVVCLEYRGRDVMEPWLHVLRCYFGPESPTAAMFPQDLIPVDFLDQLKNCASQFKGYQVEVIENNIRAFHGKDRNKRFFLRRLRYMIAEHFMVVYKMQRLPDEDEVVGKKKLKEISTLNMDPRSEEGSFNDKRKRAEMLPLQCIQHLRDDIESMNISWPYGDDMIKWIKFPVQLQKFEIQTGKPVKTVYSSKFCLGRLLKIRNQVKHLAITEFYCNPAYVLLSPNSSDNTVLTCENGNESFQDQSSSSDKDTFNVNNMNVNDMDAEPLPLSKKLMEMFPGSKILDFKSMLWSCMENSNNEEAEEEAFQDIKEAIDDIWRDSTLILLGYPMLTQFNVGMVYMLSHLFEEVGFVKPHKQDFAVIFKSFRHWNVHMRKFLDDVERKIDYLIANSIKENVLALLPINILCGNAESEGSSAGSMASGDMGDDGPREFYTCVTETNHLCVKEQTLDIIGNILNGAQ